MKKIRKKQLIDVVNYTRETLNLGTHRTVSRDVIYDLSSIIEELFQEIEDLKMDKELIPKLADDIYAVAKKLEVSEHLNSEESNELKVIGNYLHDIRAKRDTDWYKKFEVTK